MVYGKCRYCHAVLATAAEVREHARFHNYEHEGRPLRDDDTPAALAGLLYDSELVDVFQGVADETSGQQGVEGGTEKFGGGGGFSGGGASGVVEGDPETKVPEGETNAQPWNTDPVGEESNAKHDARAGEETPDLAAGAISGETDTPKAEGSGAPAGYDDPAEVGVGPSDEELASRDDSMTEPDISDTAPETASDSESSE